MKKDGRRRDRRPRVHPSDNSVVAFIHRSYGGEKTIPTKDEQYALIRRAKKGDAAALEELVVRNLPLVVKIAGQHSRKSEMDIEDLITEGVIGFMKAVQKFDLRRNLQLSTYAMWWIRQGITRAIDDKGTIIRRPVHVQTKMRKAGYLLASAQQKVGSRSTIEECAAQDGFDAVVVRKLLSQQYATEVVSTSSLPEGFEERNIASSEEPSQFNNAVTSEAEKRLENLLRILSDKERQVLSLRFGLDDNSEHTLKEVGKIIGVTRERVRQIESKALRRLAWAARRNTLKGTSG